MIGPNISYSILLFFSALATGIAAYGAYRRREAPGGDVATILLCLVTWWTLSYALHWAPVPRPEPLFWMKMTYFARVAVPAAYLVFVLRYAYRDQLPGPRTLSLLAPVPLVTLLLVWTDPMHGAFFADYEPFAGELMAGGVAYWVHALYSDMLIVLGTVLLAHSTLGAQPLYRRQTFLMLASIMLPLAVHVAVLLKVADLGAFDPTPLTFAFTGIAVVANLYRQGLFQLMPVARQSVVEGMDDGIVVFDREERVMDVNPAAREFLEINDDFEPGQPADEVLVHWDALAPLVRDYGEVSDEGTIRSRRHGGVGGTRHLHVRATDIIDKHGCATGRLLVLRDISALKQVEASLRAQLAANKRLQKELQEQAIRDPLTALYNRRFLEESLVRELARAERNDTTVGLVVIDLDNFKHINDTFGHAAGDRLLVELAALLKGQTRREDVVCRFGGEEFVVLMPGISPVNAVRRVEEWRKRFEKTAVTAGDNIVRTTLSAGIACYPSQGRDGEELFNTADQALYAAKSGGRNRVVLAPDLTDLVVQLDGSTS